MIELFEGRIGSGKTFSGVYRAIVQLVKGGTVATNIELNWEEICAYVLKRWGLILERDQYILLADDQICEFHKYTPSGTIELPVLIIIDETALNFDNRDFAESYKKFRETFTFLRQSRKVFSDIIFIAQSVTDIDKKMRQLAQYTWRFRDLSKWKIPGLAGFKFPFNWILVQQIDEDGTTVLDKDFVPKDKAIFKCYNTYSLLRKFPRLEGVTTARKLQRVERKRPSAFIFALIVFDIAALTFGLFLK